MYRRIKELREERSLTQKDLARLLNISQATYSRYENGNLDIPSAALIAIAKFHGVSVDFLLGLTNEKNQLTNP